MSDKNNAIDITLDNIIYFLKIHFPRYMICRHQTVHSKFPSNFLSLVYYFDIILTSFVY